MNAKSLVRHTSNELQLSTTFDFDLLAVQAQIRLSTRTVFTPDLAAQ